MLNLKTTLVLLVFLVLLVRLGDGRSVGKRNIFQLCDLINFYTQNSCFDYNDYGCFCGYGQVGYKPVDEVDACCRQHDTCYGRVNCFWGAQFVSFGKTCNSTAQSCRCTDLENSCGRDVCECDLGLASCLQGLPLNNEFYYYDRRQCKLDPRARLSLH